MAFRMGITGGPNTGKTFSWRDYPKGDTVFAFCPSNKMIHLTDGQGNAVEKEIEILYRGDKYPHTSTTEETLEMLKCKTRLQLMAKVGPKMLETGEVKFEASGNYVYASQMEYVAGAKKFVAAVMPQYDKFLTTDFTHYISRILSTDLFRSRKKGGEAFERFWDLAADALVNILLVADELPAHIIDVTEFHSGDYEEETGKLNVYVPAGNMLKEKFKPKSYFDLMLYTAVEDHEPGKPQKDRYKFVTIPVDGFDGRSLGLFDDIMDEKGQIPNSMKLVMSRLEPYIVHRIKK